MIEKSQRDYVLKLARTLSTKKLAQFFCYFIFTISLISADQFLTLFSPLKSEMISRHIVTSVKEVIFSSMYVCLSVSCITHRLIFMKFYGMVGYNPGTSQLRF